MMHLAFIAIKSRAAGMLPSAKTMQERLWHAVSSQHVHDFAKTTMPHVRVCIGCGATVELTMGDQG